MNIEEVIPKLLEVITEPESIYDINHGTVYGCDDGSNYFCYEDEHWFIEGYYKAEGYYNYQYGSYDDPAEYEFDGINDIELTELCVYFDDEEVPCEVEDKLRKTIDKHLQKWK